MKLEHIIASRFLKARKRNRLLSFLSITSVVGVMLGVATLIVVVSVMDGFIENLKLKFLGVNPHIMVTRMNAMPIHDWEGLMADIESVRHVEGTAPFILTNAMLSDERRVLGVIVRGISPALEPKISALADTVTSGKFDDIERNSPPGILLGKEFMFSMGLNVGKDVTLISPTSTQGALGSMIPRMRKFRVVGFVDTGMYEYNRAVVYISLAEAQNFFRLGDSVSGIGVKTDNSENAGRIAADIDAKLNADARTYWARDWLSMNESLFAALTLERYALFVILTMITIVASFNIVSMITVTVKDKKKDIAILRAMGAEEKFIERIFVRQGLIIGVMGTVLGNALALLIAFVLKNFKFINIPKEIYFSDTVPFKVSPEVFVIVTLCAVAITYVAAKIPSRLSARQDPIEAIRND